jgi:hypothetical protein
MYIPDPFAVPSGFRFGRDLSVQKNQEVGYDGIS